MLLYLGHGLMLLWSIDLMNVTEEVTIHTYKVLLLTCVVNCTAGTPTPRLCPVDQWSVHWAPNRTTRVLVLTEPGAVPLRRAGKKCELRF